jgi:adenylate kinase family enzyme
MLKAIIIGCPGSGKSTFANKLRNITKLPLYHLDMIWHKEDRTTITKEEFDVKLSNLLEKDRWIIDGNYQRTLEMRLKECDTVFLMDYPLDICIAGVKSRVGHKHDDLPWIEDNLDSEFKEKIVNFSKDKLPKIYDLLEKYKDRNIIIFHAREEADKYLKKLEKGGV